MRRRFIVAANWKMNSDRRKITNIIDLLKKSPLNGATQVVIFAPTLYLDYVRAKLPCTCRFELGAQNCYRESEGAFTGEISPNMLKDMCIPWVILGHSERRTIFHEDDDLIADKLNLAVKTGLKVIFCVGETLDERVAEMTQDVIFRQLAFVVTIPSHAWSNVVLAYEPIWAIGTGLAATPEQAQEVHKFIRRYICDKVDNFTGQTIRILYGGSVTKDNCKELAEQPDIDGFLVGGASLKSDFIDIINSRYCPCLCKKKKQDEQSEYEGTCCSCSKQC